MAKSLDEGPRVKANFVPVADTWEVIGEFMQPCGDDDDEVWAREDPDYDATDYMGANEVAGLNDIEWDRGDVEAFLGEGKIGSAVEWIERFQELAGFEF